MHPSCFRVMLTLLGLLIGTSLPGAGNPGWKNLKQLSPGQQIHVVLNSKKSLKGQFRSNTNACLQQLLVLGR
jgi:hypothetical protein